MKKVIIESTNSSATPSDIEEILQKAVSVLQAQREDRPLKDKVLQSEVEKLDKFFDKVIEHMINEINEVIK